MEYMMYIKVPSHNEFLYGLTAGDMVLQGMRVQADGKVKGLFHYVSKYLGFSGKKDEQEGYYFPFRLLINGKTMTFIKNGITIRDNIPFEEYNVFRVTPKDIFEIKVDGKFFARLDFSEARYEPKRGDVPMNVAFYDTGICGIPITGFIGKIDKGSKADKEAVELVNSLPYGTRLVNVTTIVSEDFEGSATLDLGNIKSGTAYASALALKAGEATVTDTKLAEITADKVTAKLSAAITAGTVNVFATIIRLTV